jgi:diguanylate cyclase (GGDEF)-like protein
MDNAGLYEQLKNVLGAVAGMYSCIMKVDLFTGRYDVISAEDYIIDLIGRNGDFSASLKIYINKCIAGEYRSDAEDFVCLSDLKERMDGKNSIGLEYIMVDGHWSMMNFVPAGGDEKKNSGQVLMLVHNTYKDIEKYQAEQSYIRLQFDVANALCEDFISVYCVDLDTDTYIIKRITGGLRNDVANVAKTGAQVFSTTIVRYIEAFVSEEDKELIYLITGKEYILKKFKESKVFDVRYRVKPNPAKQEFFEMHFVDIAEREDQCKFVLAWRCVDGVMKKDIEQQKALKAATDSAEERLRIIGSLADIYISMHYVNLLNDSFSELSSIDYVHDIVGLTGSAVQKLTESSRRLVLKIDQGKMMEFTDFATLQERMQGRKIISQEFRGNKSEWFRASFIAVNSDEDGRLTHVIYAVQYIGDEKKKELEYQVALKEALENTNVMFHEMIQMQSCGILAFRLADKKLVTINEAARKMFECCSPDNKAGEDCDLDCVFSKTPESERKAIFQKLSELKVAGDEYKCEFTVVHEKGPDVKVMSQAKMAELADGGNLIIISMTDISDKKRMEDELRYLSETDSLTGLLNRGSGKKKVETQLSHKHGGMFCIFDVDNFKLINDNYGHINGDRVLTAVADCMRKSSQTGDVLLRLGGDEFAVFAKNIQEDEKAEKYVLRLMESIKQISVNEIKAGKVSVSLGGVICKKGENNKFDTIYQQADMAMYKCKHGHKGAYSFMPALKKKAGKV